MRTFPKLPYLTKGVLCNEIPIYVHDQDDPSLKSRQESRFKVTVYVSKQVYIDIVYHICFILHDFHQKISHVPDQDDPVLEVKVGVKSDNDV